MFNGGGHGGRGKDMGKAKDFGKSIKRMLSEMKGFYVAIVFAIFLSVGGSILSVVAPDILAQITDEISAGIMIDNEKMANIFSEVMKDPMNESVIDGQTITVEDKMELAKLSNEYVNKAYESNGDNRAAIATQLYAAIDKMPESVQNLIRPQMNYEAMRLYAVFTALGIELIAESNAESSLDFSLFEARLLNTMERIMFDDKIDRIFTGNYLPVAVKSDKQYANLVAKGMSTYNEILKLERMK